ncbi:efflux transporter periplasmic adaptor subunit [Stenotrophomonas sp. LMG 10879]|uniref:efflux RND transporter periplasmic adaptor subunit n=1 Tax=unclassified Stenotrophomonas TaxID=196198 RepID=UPI000C1A0C94|nr:efflux RND transporter periplasmic adaptor subunit [Stenotrophomonas sp. LMG 10879]PII18770.1 efflux transporter periplasmic adaptor subunit [Stenotrophomonas sp. LMG 10879]
MKNMRWLGVGVLVVVLAACGKQAAEPVEAIPVLVVHPTTQDGQAAAAYPGEVRARQESPLSFRVGGNLVKRHVDAGERVKKGQLLAELDAADYASQAAASQAQLAAAEADLVRARDDQKRYAKLAEDQLVSRSALDQQTAAFKAAQGQANAARANLAVARNQAEYAQLRAPADGVIASRQAEAGQVVSAGQTVFTLAADGGREVLIALPESNIRDYKVGQSVQVELWNRPGQLLPGTLREIAPAADAQARTYATRVSLAPEALSEVELGQSARVFATAGRSGALQLPLAAVLRGSDGKASVWVVNPSSGALKATPVQVGAYGAQAVPVVSGVGAADWVVAAGGHLLREGQVVTPVDRQNRPVLAPSAAKPAPAAGKGH